MLYVKYFLYSTFVLFLKMLVSRATRKSRPQCTFSAENPPRNTELDTVLLKQCTLFSTGHPPRKNMTPSTMQPHQSTPNRKTADPRQNPSRNNTNPRQHTRIPHHQSRKVSRGPPRADAITRGARLLLTRASHYTSSRPPAG